MVYQKNQNENHRWSWKGYEISKNITRFDLKQLQL
jgi:hypothetical protein